MVANSINESLRQAYQGSVSAIIQILNDRLAGTGVRTRAIFEGRVLQLLCEAAKPEQLEQSDLVAQVQATLEEISPRTIRRVHIHARIIQEQQLLWLEEIANDPSKLLWSKEIVLSRPNLMKHFFAGLKRSAPEMPAYAEDTPTGRKVARQKPNVKWLVGGVVGAGLLGLAGLGAINLFKPAPSERETAQIRQSGTNQPESTAKLSRQAQAASAKSDDRDNFGAAVRLAQTAAQASQTAKSPAEWNAIAQQWGKASDLMAKVPANSSNYSVAQDRTVKYRKNQAIALKKAQS